MRSDTLPNTPRRRPTARVLVALTASLLQVGPLRAQAAEPAVPVASASDAVRAAASAPAAAPSAPVVLRQPEHAVPVYRTHIPPATTLEYDIRRGSIAGTGELSWRPDGGRYEARLQASVIGYTPHIRTRQVQVQQCVSY